MDANIYAPVLLTVGAKIPASQVGEQELIAHKKIELQRISDILDQNLLLCAQEKVCLLHACQFSDQNVKQIMHSPKSQ